MADIVISEFMDEAIVRSAFAGRDVLYDPALVDRPADLAAAVADARALIVRNRTQVRGALLAAGPRLRVVGRLGVGLDNIDVEACKARGIAVRPATGANDVSVAEYVITAMLVLLRRAWFATPDVIAGRWPRMSTIGGEVSGRTLGLIGLGAIARETAHRARALGMNIVAHDPHLPAAHAAWQLAARRELDALLADADVVSLHVPLTAETRHMLGRANLSRMKRGAILVNAARGGIVDEAALAEALRSGHLGGAALDVFEREPLDAASAQVFAGVPNLLLTPHIAGVTEESNVRVSDVTARAVLADLRD
ncbi:MAG: hydroxyacid dehydrogenase [Burkholderiaceae bacterium]|jgi:(S)-sulfolactate dehydrogenase|nr:hydroxyacid dehydrogenase [Burkholderiaceae bacterium]